MVKHLLAVSLSASSLLFAYTNTAAAQPQVSTPTTPNEGNRTARDPRGTSEFDAVPKFDQNYFVGIWNFEGTLAESPLGEGGPVSGTETVRNGLDGRFWDIAIEGEAPEGPFTGKGVILFQDGFSGQSFARYEVTRGMGMISLGTLGCDLGGSCGMYYETPPFEWKGSTVQLKGRYIITGKYAYRLTREIAVNRGAFTSLGTIWYRRNQSAETPKAIK